MGRPRARASILAKLLVAYVVPTLVLFAVFAFVIYDVARRDLEAELGKRLASVAAAAAEPVRGKYLLDLEPGDEGERAYLNTRRKLLAVKERTGVARVLIFGPDQHLLCDTDEGPAVGESYHALALDRVEIDRVLASGESVSSKLFQGKDGRYYKAGYAPVHASEDDETRVAVLRVEAPAEYFTRLVSLRRTMIQYGAALFAVVVLVSLGVATLLTRPIRRLAGAAARIGRGDLEAPVDVRARDEIGTLAETLEEMRQGLRARDERLQMMLAGIAHEVRNPLGGIELYTGILREEMAGDDGRLAHIAKIDRELAYLEAVVNDFLEYARRPKPVPEAVNVGALLEDVAEVARADAEAGRITVRVDAPANLEARGDPTQLRRALLNLARNAVQATPEGGEVRLCAEAAGLGVRLRVIDTGKGISLNERDRIFDPFFTTREKGTGLGLAFVREIISDHEGTIDVDSEPGRGTTFTVELRPWV